MPVPITEFGNTTSEMHLRWHLAAVRANRIRGEDRVAEERSMSRCLVFEMMIFRAKGFEGPLEWDWRIDHWNIWQTIQHEDYSLKEHGVERVCEEDLQFLCWSWIALNDDVVYEPPKSTFPFRPRKALQTGTWSWILLGLGLGLLLTSKPW